jgi:hypothetical protein
VVQLLLLVVQRVTLLSRRLTVNVPLPPDHAKLVVPAVAVALNPVICPPFWGADVKFSVVLEDPW